MEESSVPSLWKYLLFLLKSNLLRFQRLLQDRCRPIPRHATTEKSLYPYLLAESKTPLWVENTLSERGLQLGKAQNLRVAIQQLQQIEIPENTVFSFWRQLGRATKRKGYVLGRQISEGCLVPALGGGLCQLSNALYDVALKIDAEILERHPHSRIVPGSTAEQGRDATVYWNYIDLRFRATFPVLLEVLLTRDSLLVRLYGKSPRTVHKPENLLKIALERRRTIDIANHSCQSCGQTSCFRHTVTLPATPYDVEALGQTAYLLDERTEEFEEYLAKQVRAQDTLFLPLDGERWRRPAYHWKIPKGHRKTATRVTLLRALRSRRLADQGAPRQTALLTSAEQLAKEYARSLTPEITHLCIAQHLLPYLWRAGYLGGRTFDVLMTRLPLTHLHALLDAAHQKFPERTTLGDFRATTWLVTAEQEALEAAEHWITPHSAIAKIQPNKTFRLQWKPPQNCQASPQGDRILFLGPTVARKGAYEVREAVIRGGWSLTVLGRDLEGGDFWNGVPVTQKRREEDFWEGVACVVQPALIEDKPRLLLQALARKIPVIATAECGLEGLSGVITVPFGDSHALYEALCSIPALSSTRSWVNAHEPSNQKGQDSIPPVTKIEQQHSR